MSVVLDVCCDVVYYVCNASTGAFGCVVYLYLDVVYL